MSVLPAIADVRLFRLYAEEKLDHLVAPSCKIFFTDWMLDTLLRSTGTQSHGGKTEMRTTPEQITEKSGGRQLVSGGYPSLRAQLTKPNERIIALVWKGNELVAVPVEDQGVIDAFYRENTCIEGFFALPTSSEG